MHPAFSVLFFTVTSGFGYGFLLWLLVAQATQWWSFTRDDFLIYCAIAGVLITLGLLSSTQHLANPKNAWRSFTRFRTSWLSREGVLAVLGYPLFALTAYLIAEPSQQGGIWVGLRIALVAVSTLWIIALTYCTAMIYASLKTIPQWHNGLVPPAFVVFTLSSGLLCFGLVSQWQPIGVLMLTCIALIAGAGIKMMYFKSLGAPTRSSINTATSFSQAKVTLFDSGHSSENFLQREFVYHVGPKTTGLARKLIFVLAFVLPLLLIFTITHAWLSWAAIISAYIGLLLERWLFFVEAKHVVRHYYGE